MERKVLGRGLESLIPIAEPTQSKERVQSLKIDQVIPSRFQPRLNFSNEKISDLARSIKEKGVIQPILVREMTDGRFELIAGERRLRAVKQLGLEEIPAIIRRVSDMDLLETSIIENIQREELNPLEEAKAYQRLAAEFGHTQDHIATRVGKDKSSISNLLRLLNLPEKIQDFLSQNLISFGHARALLAIPEAKRQIKVCDMIVKKGLSVRQVEQMAAPRFRGRSIKRTDVDTDIRHLEEALQHRFGTKVRLLHGKKRGKIEIEYYSLEDLDRLLKILGLS